MENKLQSIFPSLTSAQFFHVTNDMVFDPNEDISVSIHSQHASHWKHTQDFIDLLFVQKNDCTCDFYPDDSGSSPETIHLAEHSFCIIPPNVIHTIHLSDNCSILHIFFDFQLLKHHYSDLISANNTILLFFSNMLYEPHYWNYLYFSVEYTEVLNDLLAKMYTEFLEKNPHYQNMLYYASGMLLTLAERSRNSNLLFSPRNPVKLIRYEQIYSYICDNYATTSSNEIADYFHISQSHLCKIFQEKGKTVTSTIQEIRLQHACSLLTESNLSVQNIAELIGYHDITYFIKLFKRYFSVTPYQYRKINSAD